MLTVASIASAYRDGIVDTGRETQFLFFVSFLVSFGFIRTSAHLIHAQVGWWPGNVDVGGTHIHHLVCRIVAVEEPALLCLDFDDAPARQPGAPPSPPPSGGIALGGARAATQEQVIGSHREGGSDE
jgi:hypothetical protein